MQYTLCHTCTCAVEYDDYSAFDYYMEEGKVEKVLGWVTQVGLITHVFTTYDDDGTCDACGDKVEGDVLHSWSSD